MSDEQPVPGSDLLGPGGHVEVHPEPIDAGAAEVGRPLPFDRHPHKERFNVAYAALAGVALAAVAAAALFAAGRHATPEPKWSSWHPTDEGYGAVAQIADHLAPRYELDNGGQLVAVKGGPMKIADLPVTVALRDSNKRVSVLRGDGVLYTLCGLGPKCAIATGKASVTRHLLLRRETLELALYTFRYVRGADYVVALMPPRKGKTATQALLYTKDGLHAELERPLDATLGARPPLPAVLPRSPELPVIERLTNGSLFQFSVQQGQDASAFLVLDKLTLTQG